VKEQINAVSKLNNELIKHEQAQDGSIVDDGLTENVR